MRLIARFAQEKEKFFEIITVYDKRTIKERLNKKTPALISIAEDYPAAVWFERKITDDFGIEILYSNDKRPLVKHEHFPENIYPLRKNFTNLNLNHRRVKEEKPINHGVVLGPTHPYLLESSQMQIFDKESKILHFEMMLFYKHRGIEKMVEGLSLEESKPIIERISASQSIAYQQALLSIQLQASKKRLPEVLKKYHAFLLEFERILNYLSELSILCQSVDFHEGGKLFSKHLELGREALKELTGHRFGFSSISVENEKIEMEKTYEYLFTLEKELYTFEKWIETKDKILEEMLLLGQISKEEAKRYGVVGITARASQISLDRRIGDSFYEKNDFFMNREEGGDSFSRFNIRISEIFTSLRMMRNMVSSNFLPFFLGTYVDGEYYAYVESSAGEVMMYIAIENEKIIRFFLRDPSFMTAQALPLALKGSDVQKMGIILNSFPLDIATVDL